MLNVADTQFIKLFINEEEFSMFSGTVLSSKRWLNMALGITARKVVWRSPKGNEVEITIKRMTSFHQLPLFTIDYEVIPLNFSGDILIESHHDGNVLNFGDPSDPRTAEECVQYLTPVSCEIKQGVSYITSETYRSGLSVCSCVSNVMSGDHDRVFFIDNNDAVCSITAKATEGKKNQVVEIFNLLRFHPLT